MSPLEGVSSVGQTALGVLGPHPWRGLGDVALRTRLSGGLGSAGVVVEFDIKDLFHPK